MSTTPTTPSNYLEELLLLTSIAATKAKALLNPASTAGQVASVSADLLAAIQAVLQREASNQGKSIQDVIATL